MKSSPGLMIPRTSPTGTATWPAMAKPMPWWWCDAFFMAPAGMTRLSEITKDRKYIDAMDKQWWVTYDRLYDKTEHLFYRDSSYLTQNRRTGRRFSGAGGMGGLRGARPMC